MRGCLLFIPKQLEKSVFDVVEQPPHLNLPALLNLFKLSLVQIQGVSLSNSRFFKLFVYIFSLFPILLFSGHQVPICSFQAEKVSYDGTTNMFYGVQAIMKFSENDTLECGTAEFDQTLKSGLFKSGLQGPYAIYQGSRRDGQGSLVPIEIKGKQILFENQDHVMKIVAENDVVIKYNQKYLAVADRASYQCGEKTLGKGSVHLMSDSLYPCQITNREGDCIQADQVWIDIENKQMVFDRAKGFVHLPSQLDSKLELSAKTLRWNENEGKILLNDDVLIHCQGFGVICSEEAILEYRLENEIIQPKRLTIKGNVKMRNQFADIEGGTPLDQYALADLVTFDPFTRKMHFQSKIGKRVLFYDKANHMQISAPALLITSGTKVGKESIQGLGNVHFTFAEQELELLRKQFPKI